MHRYEELEKLYYRKKFLKIVLVVIFIILVIVGIFYIINLNHLNKKVEKKSKIKNTEIKTKNQKTLKSHSSINSISKKNNSTKISNNSTKKNIKEKNETNKNYEIKFILPNINFIKEPKNINKQKIIHQKPKQKIKNKEKNITQKKVNLNVKIVENNADLNTLINEFKNSKDYNIAITISKIYLKRNNLKKAQIWALNANSLKPSSPESWLIFADILIKKHKIKKAKEILNVYINSYGNNDIIEEKLRSLNGK